MGLAFLLGMSVSHSAEIPLLNSSFTVGSPDVPGWSQEGDANDSGVADTEGRWSAEVSHNGPLVFQSTAHLMSAGQGYTLALNAKDAFASNEVTVRLYRLDPGNIRTTLTTLVTPINGTWTPFSLSYTALASDAGFPIGIEFDNSSASGWASFDEFTLNAGANAIPLINPDFSANNEGTADNGLGFDQGGMGEIPGWSQVGDSNRSVLAERDGRRTAELFFNGPFVHQTTVHLISVGDSFTVTFDAKGAGGANAVGVRLYRLDPGDIRTRLATLTAPITGSWTSSALTYTALSTDAGRRIGLEFSNTSAAGVASFDDFALDVVPRRPPVAIPLINANFLANSDGSADNGAGFDQAGAAEVPGWSQEGDANDSGVAETGGRWSAELSHDGPLVFQTTAHLMSAGNKYKLSFNSRDAFGSNQITANLYRLDPGDVRTILATLDAPIRGPWAAYTLSYTAVAADAGLPIGIQFDNTSSNGWASFDEFALEFTSDSPVNTFAAWVSGFAVGALNGLNDDPDKDGLPNGIENLLGSSPAAFNPGLSLVPGGGSSVVFQHSRSNTPAGDLAGTYEWSTNLTTWNASGVANAGTTVTFVATTVTDTNAPANDLIQVRATVSAGTPPRVYVRYKVSRL